MMGKIYGAFCFAKGIGKGGRAVKATQPMPGFQIVAYGRPEIAQAGVLQMKSYGFSLGPLHAERPVKPIFGSITQFVFQYDRLRGLVLHDAVSADEICVDFHNHFPFTFFLELNRYLANRYGYYSSFSYDFQECYSETNNGIIISINRYFAHFALRKLKTQSGKISLSEDVSFEYCLGILSGEGQRIIQRERTGCG